MVSDLGDVGVQRHSHRDWMKKVLAWAPSLGPDELGEREIMVGSQAFEVDISKAFHLTP